MIRCKTMLKRLQKQRFDLSLSDALLAGAGDGSIDDDVYLEVYRRLKM